MAAHDGRFAPSPTGELHLGNLRTALLAWLFARTRGGRFVVRMEDLDTDRVRPGAEQSQLADLGRLGLDWDEPVVRQSERLALYAQALAALEATGLTYPCFCTRREIREASSAPHGELPEGAYPGTCRELTARARAERETSGRPAAVRLRAGEARVEFDDLVAGPVSGTVDDFVLRRGDGMPAYNLAVVVDDADQAIGEVVRGADLVDSTPRQILLGRLLGLPEPRFAHVPIVVGEDGRRLAKRHGAVTLRERELCGEAPEEITGRLAATVGLAEPGEALTPRELIPRFDRAALAGEATVFAPAGAGNWRA